MYEPENFVLNASDRVVVHNPTQASFTYDAAYRLSLRHPAFATADELPYVKGGAEQVVRRERDRDPNIVFEWGDALRRH
jgi:hypothetical protein